jgi:hypothetical protein
MSSYLHRLVARSLRTTPAVRSALSLPFATLPIFDEFDDTPVAPIARHAEGVPASEHNPSRNHFSDSKDHFSLSQNDKPEVNDTIDSDVLHHRPLVDSEYKSPSTSYPISKDSPSHKTKGQISFNNVQSNFDISQEQSSHHFTTQTAQQESIQSRMLPSNSTVVVDDPILKGSIQSRRFPDNSAQKIPIADDISIKSATNSDVVTSFAEDASTPVKDSLWQRQTPQAKAERSEQREPPPRLVEGSRAKTPNPRQQNSISTYDKRNLHNNISLKQAHEEPTEVHVTIGRIEVTAVHTPPTPKRQSEPVNKLMSLDEYLANRQKGRT